MSPRTWITLVVAVASIAGSSRADELRCVYAVTQETVERPPYNGPNDARPRGEPKRTSESYTLTLGLAGDDFTLTTDKAPEVFVCQFSGRRIYTLNPIEKTYTDDSLYAEVVSRVHELTSRMASGAVLAAAGRPAREGAGSSARRPLDAFPWESLVSMRLPQGPPGLEPPTAKAVPRGKGWDFHHGDETVVQFTPSDRPLPGAYRRALLHFLIYRCRIHPTIRQRIVAAEAIPAALSFKSVDERSEQKTSYALGTVSVSPDGWKGIPKEYERKLDPSRPLDRVLKKLEDARAKTPPANRPALTRCVDESLKRGEPLDAYLAWTEYVSRTGDQANDVARWVRGTRGDRLRVFTGDYPMSREGIEQRLKDLDALDRTGLKKAHMLDAFAGTLLTLLDRPREAEPRFLKALDANPLLVHVYIQLGDLYEKSFEMRLAWRCFDAARSIDPDARALEGVKAIETRLEKDFPDNF